MPKKRPPDKQPCIAPNSASSTSCGCGLSPCRRGRYSSIQSAISSLFQASEAEGKVFLTIHFLDMLSTTQNIAKRLPRKSALKTKNPVQKAESQRFLYGGFLKSVREGGLEPPHPYGRTHLKRMRLPIPPFPLLCFKKRRKCTVVCLFSKSFF